MSQEQLQSQAETPSLKKGGPEKAKDTEVERRQVALTLGNEWAQVFENSLARKMAKILHLPLLTGLPLNHVCAALFEQELLVRLNQALASNQASELVFRIDEYLKVSDIVLVDNKLLDRAIGQYVISRAKERKLPCYGVGVDGKTSVLAPAFIKGILYPESADDLVELVLRERV